MRKALARTAVITAIGAIGMSAGMTVASAAQPELDVQNGLARVYLSPEETQALNNSPIPDVLEQVIPQTSWIAQVYGNSNLDNDDEQVRATVREIVAESAGAGQSVYFGVTDPIRWRGLFLYLAQL